VEKTDKDPRYSLNPILLWAANQRRDDHESWLLAKKQRLTYVSLADNYANYTNQKAFGDNCWMALKQYLGWSQVVPWDELKYHRAIETFQERRGERSEAMKKGSLNRADPNARIMISLKQQLKLKDEDWKPSKPPQPIWIHPDYELFADGPYGTILLELLLENKPDYWHFHAKASYESYAKFVQDHYAGVKRFHMEDQTGQDSTAQGWAVRVLENLMRHFSFPEEVVQRFVHTKLHKTLDGKVYLLICTDSGEVWTFLINTVSAAARVCFKYDLLPGVPLSSGGDDTMLPAPVLENPMYVPFKVIDPCSDKIYESDRGDFTSHGIKDGVLFKNPIILLKRFLVKLASGRGEEAVLGYGEMWLRNYKLRELLPGLMTSEELRAHSIMTRIFFNLKKEGLKTRLSWSDLYDVDVEQIPIEALESHKELVTHAQVIQPDVNRFVQNYIESITRIPVRDEYTSLF